MLKQKSRFIALFMALCLAVSVLAVPAAAADLSSLQADLERAKSVLSSAQSALAETERILNAEKDAEAARDAAKAAHDAAPDTAPTGPDGNPDLSVKTKADLKDAMEAAERAFEGAKLAAETAKANIAEKEAAVTEAQNAVTAAQRAYDDAKAAADAENKASEEEQRRGLTPGSGDLSFSVSSVDLGTLEKDTTSGLSRTFTITNNHSVHTMYLSVSNPTGYTVTGVPSSLGPGSSATVSVTLNSTASEGTNNRTLQISGYYEENGVRGNTQTFSLSLYATVGSKGYTISASPSTKDLGKLAEGYDEKAAKETEITVTIENKGVSSVQMDGVKGNDHFTVTAVASESVTLKTGEKTDYKVVPKNSLAVGSYTDTITFQTREGATATLKATVVVEKKLAPLSVEPAALNFGSVEEGYTAVAQQSVTLKNNTDGAIRVDQPTSYSYEISTLSQTTLPAGGTATFTVRPRTGLPANTYNGEIIVTSSSEQAKLTVQFTVTRPAGPSSFNDVAANSTFAADIAYVSQKGLMSGVGNGNFNPQSPITRGQLVTILYRLEGQPAVSGLGFSDVAAGSYCEKAVKWAAATGITNGNADGLFKPNDPISREQLATFLYRYNRHKGFFTSKLADLSGFSDAGAIASYARDALSWANGSGLVNGTSDGRLNPSGGATRGQAAAILHRYCVSIGQ